MASSMGTVYAANTVGSILGSLSAGMLLLAITRDLNTILIMMIFLSLAMSLGAGGVMQANDSASLKAEPTFL